MEPKSTGMVSQVRQPELVLQLMVSRGRDLGSTGSRVTRGQGAQVNVGSGYEIEVAIRLRFDIVLLIER